MKYHLLVLALVVIAGLSTMGCSSGSDNKSTSQPSNINTGGNVNVPTWFLALPSEPGKAFYGSGTGTYTNSALMQNGMNAADQNARNQIAATMQTKVASLLKQYMRSVLTPENQTQEEALTQSVLQALVQFTLRGCAIVKREIHPSGDGKSWVVYSLSRIGFDDVAENLHAETSKAVQRVERNAKVAFDELNALLKQEAEKDGVRPAPSDLTPLPSKAGQ